MNSTISFSHIVCSAASVRDAFVIHPSMNRWWRIVLWLHGKPGVATISPEKERQIVVAGFRFYANLYRALALILALCIGACLPVGIIETARDMFYIGGFGALSSLYLWGAGSLGMAGANALAHKRKGARLALLAFMVMIIGFLTPFVTLSSVAFHLEAVISPLFNLGLTATLWAVGIGSYGIEILYLATMRND